MKYIQIIIFHKKKGIKNSWCFFKYKSKLTGNTPCRPSISPFHQPLSSTSLETTLISCPSSNVNSSSFTALYGNNTIHCSLTVIAK